jgi:HD-like signal output (HDOD) protein
MRRVLAEADFPAISREVLDTLRTVPDDNASLQRLATVVTRDYSLTLKVIRTANSAYYKHTSQHTQGVAHAMMLLGARTVRQLASAMPTFDPKAKEMAGLKALMALSMLTACCARDLARHSGIPDPDEAYLCGMFRNLGEVVTAGYFAKEYERIQQLMRGGWEPRKSAEVAAIEVLGFAFEDLGAALAKYWGMPESVVAAIRTDPAVAAGELTQATAFAHELIFATYRAPRTVGLDPISQVLARFGKRSAITREQAEGLTKTALRDAQNVLTAARLTVDDLRLGRAMGGALQPRLRSWPRPAADAPVPAEPTASERALAARRGELIAEAVRASAPESGVDVNRAMLALANAINRGGPFDRVVYCSVAPDRTNVRARLGLGAGVDLLLERFTFDLTPRQGPVAVAVLRRQSAYLPTERAFTAQEQQFAHSLGASSFGLFPLFVGGQALGVLYCDRLWKSGAVDQATVAFVRLACDDVSRALGGRVNGDARPTTGRTTPLAVTPSYPAVVKSQAVLRVLKGEPAADVAAELAVATDQVERWRSEFLAGAEARLRRK